MGIFNWFRHKQYIHQKEDISQNLHDISIPIYRTESKDKILETRIRPVKIPTIVDIGEKLGLILKELQEIKFEMVSKSWLNSEYNDTNDISKKIDIILQEIQSINYYDKNIIKKADDIIELLASGNKMTYSEIKEKIGITDPTLSRQLKTLVDNNTIKRERKGRSVFYFV